MRSAQVMLERVLRAAEGGEVGGATFDRVQDSRRLSGQCGRVFRLMSDGVPRTLQEIRDVTRDPEASISARLRDFRKAAFGGHTVRCRRAGEGGLHTYQLILKQEQVAS